MPYPADRIELLKRISPPTTDVAYPVDLFVQKPAPIWNMPVERPFGKWSVLTAFNYTGKTNPLFIARLDAAKDLRLNPDKEYLAYDFWSKQFIGTFKGAFVARPLNPYDCDIYSIVEKQDHPVLISTSRHVRQMAFDIKDPAYDSPRRMLHGISRAVAGDPYQLRLYVPDGFTAKRAELSDDVPVATKADGNLVLVDFTASTGTDADWKIFFQRAARSLAPQERKEAMKHHFVKAARAAKLPGTLVCCLIMSLCAPAFADHKFTQIKGDSRTILPSAEWPSANALSRHNRLLLSGRVSMP